MKRNYLNIKQIKTKKVPIKLKFKRKDGSIIEINATKIIKEENKK